MSDTQAIAGEPAAAVDELGPNDSPVALDRVSSFRVTYLSIIALDRKSTRLNSSHVVISYAVFCLKKKIPSDS